MNTKHLLMAKYISILAYAYTFFIVFASLGKFAINFLPSEVSNSDKINHFMAYAFLSFVWSAFFYLKKNITIVRVLLFSLLFSVLFGVLMECSQWLFTSYRQFDYYDIIANLLGSLTGILFFCIYFVLIRKKEA